MTIHNLYQTSVATRLILSLIVPAQGSRWLPSTRQTAHGSCRAVRTSESADASPAHSVRRRDLCTRVALYAESFQLEEIIQLRRIPRRMNKLTINDKYTINYNVFQVRHKLLPLLCEWKNGEVNHVEVCENDACVASYFGTGCRRCVSIKGGYLDEHIPRIVNITPRESISATLSI